jgi:sulfopyruvate decarboxylase TPP-binding subunit
VPLASTPRDGHARLRRRNSRLNVQETGTSQDRSIVAQGIADQLADCGVRLIASLPDNWLTPLIDMVAVDSRFTHVAVNREESAVGLCSGATMGGLGSAAIMGASGFMTVIYAITKINYSYEIPLFMLITLRGAFGDHHKHHVSNGLYLRPVMDAINLPYTIIDRAEGIPQISRAYRHSRTYVRPVVVALTRDLLR